MSRKNEFELAAESGAMKEAPVRADGEIVPADGEIVRTNGALFPGAGAELPSGGGSVPQGLGSDPALSSFGGPYVAGRIHTDPLGSYTGIVLESPAFDPAGAALPGRGFERPTQDADDL